MLHAAILRSPYPHARVKRLDLSRTQRLDGVRAVLSLDEEEVRFAGQEVAAVAAISSDLASDAIRLIDVQYEQLPFVVELEPAMEPSAPLVFGRSSNMEKPRLQQRGDIARAFKDAATVHEAVYLTPVQTHVSLRFTARSRAGTAIV